MAVTAAVAAVGVTKVAVNNSGNYTLDGTTIKAPLLYYNTVMLAGAQVALGAIYQAPVNLQLLYNQGYFAASGALQSIVDAFYPSTAAPSPNSSVLDSSGLIGFTGAASVSIPTSGNWLMTSHGFETGLGMNRDNANKWTSSYSSGSYSFELIKTSACVSSYPGMPTFCYANRDRYNFNTTTAGKNYPVPGAPVALPVVDVPAFNSAVKDAAVANPAVKTALNAAVVAQPQSITAPAAITAADVAASASATQAAAIANQKTALENAL
ncbi:hypothetical protein JZU71_04940, partial [bacterium]|nr:hypothetical protein [bacterium]